MGKANASLLVETSLRVIGVDVRDVVVMVDLGASAARLVPVGGVRTIAVETNRRQS
jgi:hypothetical protein